MPLHICTHLKGQGKMGKQQVEAGGGGGGIYFPSPFPHILLHGHRPWEPEVLQAPCAHWLYNPR